MQKIIKEIKKFSLFTRILMVIACLIILFCAALQVFYKVSEQFPPDSKWNFKNICGRYIHVEPSSGSYSLPEVQVEAYINIISGEVTYCSSGWGLTKDKAYENCVPDSCK